MNRSSDTALTEAVAQKAALRAERDALRLAAIHRWLRSNEGEPLTMCVRATGCPEPLVRSVAKAYGHRMVTHPKARRFKEAR